MGISTFNTNFNFPNKYNLDGSKIYNVETGQAVFDLEDLTLEQLKKLYLKLEKEKELRQQLK
ncbi:hypothetical protein [Clostridium rectalis]|uniref:hypothetical protein n=1 Tax=Clostridium rectalis TaxID=2040295 RepID=UPI0013DDA36E|nr:hypothetical protein [Clostridium rectalis]